MENFPENFKHQILRTVNLHFDALDFDTPRESKFIQSFLQIRRNEEVRIKRKSLLNKIKNNQVTMMTFFSMSRSDNN